MKDFERRLARLEQVIAGGQMYVLAGPADMPRQKALATLGLTPGEQDLVVYVRRFCNPAAAPELLSVHPME